MFRIAAAVSLVVSVGCAGEITEESVEGSALELETLDDTTIAGSFVHAGTVIAFESHSADQQFGTLSLNIDGRQIDVSLDLATMIYEHNGYESMLGPDDLAALDALSDAIADNYPDLVTETLFGKLLVKHTNRLADAPSGYTIGYRYVDASELSPDVVTRSRSCNDDGVKCMSGSGGWANAYYDKSGGSCIATYQKYGKNAAYCAGRCGAGCKWWDQNYTQDCFDHDMCVILEGGSNYSDNPHCGDEFWHADDDYVVTYYPWYC
jgi:hypothetical protein